MVELASAPPGVHAEPGDLHAAISGDRLLVPREVLEALSPQKLRNAEELHAYLSSFPMACAKLLRWSVDDCLQAAQQLGATLSAAGHSVAGRRAEPGMGAMDPHLLGPRR
jgi:hypothetical protein